MDHFSIKKVAAPLPSSCLQDANWADAYEFCPLREPLDALGVARAMFEQGPPAWVRLLNATRNSIVRPFGIKPGQISIDETVEGAFPLLALSREAAVYGFDDWHLNFRVLIEVRDMDATRAVRLTTLVRRHNVFGYCYIFLISPFHRLIVKRLLRNLAGR